MYEVDLGDGYRMVPGSSVSLNGNYFSGLNAEDVNYSGSVCLLLPDCKAAMNIESNRPFIYPNPDECREDAKTLKQILGTVGMEHKNMQFKPVESQYPNISPAPSLFYLQNRSAGYVGNSPIWWRKGGGGYTSDLEDAKTWNEQEADAQIRSSRGSHTFVKWPVEYVLSKSKLVRVVDISDLHAEDVVK